ncbi:hypothetical protein SCLCIDRAFT_485479 [Scleroderma citrinum Foug A]|uniref:Uncharacterized protein n=1 Tax=Scleroderma citrinum Foug A TaxID=1036808 RepID=A0A0C2YSV4_9AGAM|nr:hypothetical protein SCLCIDRAFT_485479 [Scleroderma citrinum Foug A]
MARWMAIRPTGPSSLGTNTSMRSQWRLVLWCYPTPLHVHPGHLRDLSRLLRKAFVKTGFFSDNSPEAIAHDLMSLWPYHSCLSTVTI